jgi:hypothetical protein
MLLKGHADDSSGAVSCQEVCQAVRILIRLSFSWRMHLAAVVHSNGFGDGGSPCVTPAAYGLVSSRKIAGGTSALRNFRGATGR